MLGCMIVPVFMASLLNPLASHRIPFTEALLCVNSLVDFHLMAHYWYHTETTIEYMENYLSKLHSYKDVLSLFHASKSTKKLSEAWCSRLLWPNSRNVRVTPLGTIVLHVQSVIAMIKIQCRSGHKLHNTLSTNQILTLWRGISWTTCLTLSASLANSELRALNSQNKW